MRRTVLLVEDEAKLADVLAEQLAEEDFDVRQARSLRQALRMLDDLVPDVAVDRHRASRRIGPRRPAAAALRRRPARQRHAGARPDGAHRGSRRPARVRAGRRRLPAQAVRAARADRPGARAARARDAGCMPTSASAICCSSPSARRASWAGSRAAALRTRVRPAARARTRPGRGALEGRPAARGLAHARDAAHAHRRLAREPPAAQARGGRRARRTRSSTSGGGVTASKSLVRSSCTRHLPLEARLSIAVAARRRARARGDRPARRRSHPRPRRERGPGEPRAHAQRGARPRLQRGRVPHVPGTRLAWIDGGARGRRRSADRGCPRRARVRSRHASPRRASGRGACSPSAARPQHVERDLLLIEAEGLAPIGLVLVLVGVRLFERAGRRHRKQLETIVDRRPEDRRRRARRRARAGPAARSGAWPGRSSTSPHGLRDLDRERGLYVSQVSHDLRNPLAVIGTYASVLRRGERSRPRAAKLQTIEDEVSRLAVMVDDLLALGRTHALPLHIQRAPADVRALVADAVAAARARSGQTRVLLLAPAAAVTRRGGCAAAAPGTRQPARQRRPPRAQRGARRAHAGLAARARAPRRGRRSRHRPASCCRASSTRSRRAPTASGARASGSRR